MFRMKHKNKYDFSAYATYSVSPHLLCVRTASKNSCLWQYKVTHEMFDNNKSKYVEKILKELGKRL